ncbi:MAG: InlB B-repeat-containing protein [Spirochaetota bacterium]
MPKITWRLPGAAVAGIMVLALGACSLPLPWLAKPSDKASLEVRLPSVPDAADASRIIGSRDIVPSPLTTADLKYRVELSPQSGDPVVRDSLAVTAIAVDGLVPGKWNLKVTGYLTAANDLFQDSVPVDLVAGPNTVNLVLKPLQTPSTGLGNISLFISWPAGQVDSATAYLATDPARLRDTALKAGELSTVNATSSTLTLSKTDIPSGTYYLTVDLMMGTALAATVIEVVQIYDYRTSKAAIVLDGKISRPPDAPTKLAVASRKNDGIDFSWLDNSNTETGYEFHDGIKWQKLNAGTASYSVAAPPIVATTYKVRATNPFGASTEISYAFAPCFVTYSANTGDKGTAPVDAYVYEAGSSAKAMAIGTMAKTGFSFAGWNTNAGGTGTAYNPADSFVLPAGGMTLYAQWTPNTAAITISLANPFDDTSGSLDPDKSGLALGSSISSSDPGNTGQSLDSIRAILDRAKGESVTLTATGGSYTNYKWMLSGSGVLPVLTGTLSSSAILTTDATTELAVVTVTLAFGNGRNTKGLPLYQYTRSLRIQIVDLTQALPSGGMR